jgi:hypothetical protein
MTNVTRSGLLGFKAFCLAATMICTATCIAADLDITRQDGPAGPQVGIEVQTSFERGPRTVTVPRDLTRVERMLPGSANEYTDGSSAQYYGMLGCGWSGLRARLKTQLESNTRETLVFIMRNYLNKPNESLKQKLDMAFGAGPNQHFFYGVGGHNGLPLNETMRQQLRAGQQVPLPGGTFPEECVVTGADARQLLESVIRAYESYTGVSRNQQ